MRKMVVSVAAVLCMVLADRMAQGGRWDNIVPNPGFEEVGDQGWAAGGWSRPNTNWRTDDTIAHSGKRSVTVVNSDPKLYAFPSLVIPCGPGQSYDLSAWVKTKDVKDALGEAGGSLGATLCIQWSDANGKWMGGFYEIHGLLGTQDWQRISAENIVIPKEAAKVTFTVYLRKGVVGQAWFDDVSVTRHRGPLLSTVLLKPNYRGTFLAPGEGRLLVALNLGDHDLGPDSVTLKAEAVCARPAGMRTVWSRETVARSGNTVFTFDSAWLPKGKSELTVSVTRRDTGQALASAAYRLEKRKPPTLRGGAWIDERNTLIVDGKPFFPLGWYFGGGVSSPQGAKDLEALGGTAFNCIMNYGICGGPLDKIRAYMDKADQVGVKIIFSVKDIYTGTKYCPSSVKGPEDEEAFVRRMVSHFGRHRALLAWYLNDELPPSYLQRLRDRYRLMCEIEPNHPAWIVHYYSSEKQLAPYADTTDVMGIDPYPIPSKPVTYVSQMTDAAVAAVQGARPVWVVPQAFGWYIYHVKEVRAGKRPPTEKELQEGREPSMDEIRCMSYLALIHGAKGLVYYHYHDLKKSPNFEKRWAGMKEIAAELKKLSEVVLAGEPLSPWPVTCDQKPVDFTVRRLHGATYVLATNASDAVCTATFKVAESLQPRPSRVERMEGGEVKMVGGSFSEELPPFACRVYRMR